MLRLLVGPNLDPRLLGSCGHQLCSVHACFSWRLPGPEYRGRLEPPGQPGPLCRQEGASQTCPGWSHPARGCDSSTHGPFRKPRAAASSGDHTMGSESLLYTPAPPMPIARSSSYQRTCCARAGWGEVVELWHRTLMGPPFMEPQQRTVMRPVSPPSLWDVEHQKCHFPI